MLARSYTKQDLGIPDSLPACSNNGNNQTKLSSFSVTFGTCCSHADVIGLVHSEEKPISVDIEIEDYSWSSVEPAAKCADDCSASHVGETICVRNPRFHVVDDSKCSGTKPEPPLKVMIVVA